MSSGKGIVVHQQSCRNMTETSSKNQHLSVQWSEHVEGEYLAFLRIDVANQRGVLANLATTIANASSNIEQVNLTEKDGRISTIEFVVVVTNRIHLARIMKKLRLLSVVIRISRK
jgi:(p)ppGpp synthase/HD superfamily hydrolase